MPRIKPENLTKRDCKCKQCGNYFKKQDINKEQKILVTNIKKVR